MRNREPRWLTIEGKCGHRNQYPEKPGDLDLRTVYCPDCEAVVPVKAIQPSLRS